MNYEEKQAALLELLDRVAELPFAEECSDAIKDGRLVKKYSGIPLATAGHLASIYETRAKLSARNDSIHGLNRFVTNLKQLPPDLMVAASTVTDDQYIYDIFTDVGVTQLIGLVRINISERLKSNSENEVGLQAFIKGLRP